MTSPAGAFLWGELNTGSFGLVSAFDTTGAVQAAADSHPYAQYAGVGAGILVGGLGSFGKLGAAESTGGMRSAVLANIAESQAARQSSNFGVFAAREAQVTSGYAVDDFAMTTLPKGTIVYGGNPLSSWFTNKATIQGSGLVKQSLWGSLQVKPNAIFGPRTSVNAYEVLRDVRVPSGSALNNPSFGSGGGWQFYLNQSNTSVLRQIGNTRLR